MNARILLVAVLCAVTPGSALAQALTSLASVRVGYVTRKNTVKPQGELKAQIDALDAQIAEAARLGRNGELRRLYAKGSRCSPAGPWTDAADFANSLVLRTRRAWSSTPRGRTPCGSSRSTRRRSSSSAR